MGLASHGQPHRELLELFSGANHAFEPRRIEKIMGSDWLSETLLTREEGVLNKAMAEVY